MSQNPTPNSNPDINGQTVNDAIKAAKIFQIDDEPIVVKTHETHLAGAGFTNVYSFTDSVEAIETLRYVTPGIILTDINMPEVSGDFLIKLIRTFQHLRSVPIVAVTSDANEESNTSILRKGADAIIHKPVDAETLVERVTETLLRTMENPTPNPKTENCDNLIEQKKAAVKSAEAELWNILREQDRTEQKKTDTKSAESELWNVLREQDRTEQKKADVKSVESELWKMMR